jgi:hypothetical protein
MHRHHADNIARADALLLGRVTYEMMEEAWRPVAQTGVRPAWVEPFARTIDLLRSPVKPPRGLGALLISFASSAASVTARLSGGKICLHLKLAVDSARRQSTKSVQSPKIRRSER